MGMPDPGTTVAIRAATAADADAMARVAGRSWEATYRGMLPDAVLDEWIATVGEGWRAAFADAAPDSPWRPWVAELDARVVGYATTTPAKSFFLPPPDGAGEVTNLYLDPDVIGTGTGRRLYEHAVGDLRQRGYNPLVIWAFRENVRAVRFYERMGLRVDVPDHDWLLGGVPCPVVRLRLDWPSASPE